MELALISVNQNDADPPLGIAYLSSYIKKYAKHPITIRIIDKEEILNAIQNNHFDIIGIASLSTDFHKAHKYAQEISKISPSSYLILGGVHITIMPQHFKNTEFDIGIIGEGEQTLLEVCELFSEKHELPLEDLSKINGLVFKDKNKDLITTAPRAFIKNLDDIPFPDRDSLKMKEIYLVPQVKAGLDNIGIFTTMFTSRGCPYSCIFCSSTSFWDRKIRLNSAEYVVKEIEMLVNKYGVEGIHIFDDLFAVSKSRVKEIADMLEEKGLTKKVRFSLLLRTSMTDEEIIKDLKRMNVTHVGFGFETASPRMLKFMKGDSATVEKHQNAVILCRKYGLHVSGSFILGNPSETKEDMELTLKFLRDYPLDQMNINQLVPMPKTDVWNMAKEWNFVDDSFDFTINHLSNLFVHEFNPNLILSKDITIEEFKEIFFRAQGMVRNTKVSAFKFRMRYLMYLKNPWFIKKLWKRRKRIMYMMGIRKQDSYDRVKGLLPTPN